MIDIVRLREVLLELKQQVNDCTDTPIEGVVLAVREGHMVKRLKDKEGIWLCGNYPDAELKGNGDSHEEGNNVLLFLLEKVNAGSVTAEEELQHYACMQRLMKLIKDALLSNDVLCGKLDANGGMLTEWEFDVFGGWNGLSVGLKMTDYD